VTVFGKGDFKEPLGALLSAVSRQLSVFLRELVRMDSKGEPLDREPEPFSSAPVGPSDIEHYLQLFRGREDCFAQQGEDFYFPVPRTLDEFYIRRHLDGDLTLGLYVLNSASSCHLICIDIDIPKGELEQVEFTNSEQKYAYLKEQLNAVIETLSLKLSVPLNSMLLEETGGRGYHIWVFFDGPVKGHNAVKFGASLKVHLEFEIEFFPKQGCLTPNRKYGNLIKLPLGIHRKYNARSSFFTLGSDGPLAIAGTNENLGCLRSVTPISADEFEAFVDAITEELPLYEKEGVVALRPDQRRPMYKGSSSILITHCTAMCNLRAKAEKSIRFSQSESFYFADVMLSVSDGADLVHETMRLSLAGKYVRSRTQNEIERIIPLHPPSCVTLLRKGVCPGYCKESVRKKNEDVLVPGTTPCSVWLLRESATPIVDSENLVERIGNSENVRRSFFQLRQYQEHEDALFFDPFDYEQFERCLDANCAMLGKALLERSETPFLGFMSVEIPKKINSSKELEYRGMSYSTVYDQVVIQALFNEISPFVENELQPSCYGYRWNAGSSSPYRIFEDWREAYPRFRKDIMAALEKHPSGFHICCDIKGYYDNIDHSILLEQLRKIVPDTYVHGMIERMVQAYTFVDGGACGLPQGPAYARLLANLYLNDFDIHANHMAVAYFRYVDDFVLVFKTERDAIEGLERVVHLLSDLCLELSPDEAKRAVIMPNTDISRVRKTLDKIHYGILEGTRHVEHLAPQAVTDFMEAVQRHSVSPVNLEELIQINETLPSLLYVVTQETLFPHQLQRDMVDIVEFLIQHGWFCPKKLKKIFYRLLDLESDEERLFGIFQAMQPTYKVYFLLSVYGSWQSRGEYQTLLRRLVLAGAHEDSAYVLGFSLAIAAKLGLHSSDLIERKVMMERLSGVDNRFVLLKWLPTVDYLAQSDDDRVAIRHIVGPRSHELHKMLLLSNLTKLPSVYADSVYLSGLLADGGVLTLSVACNLLVAATDRGEVFDALTKLMASRFAFKPLVISFVSKGIFDKRSAAGLAEIENLKSLYACVADEELKLCMLGALSRIRQYGLSCDEEFAKRHKEIARYNECFLFESMGERECYDYLELIPARRVRDNIIADLEAFKSITDDFGVKTILPRSSIFYDSSKDEIRIEYKTEERYRVLNPSDFSLTHESVFCACALASEVYRKACYFRRFTGKAPHISPENLLVDVVSRSAVFRTVGRSLCGLHVVHGTKVGDEDADIARMLASLLETLLFQSQSEYTEFVKTKPQSGINAFLCLFMQRLKAKNPDRRYTSSRFAYLVDQLQSSDDSQPLPYSLEVIYLRERLKGGLFSHNSKVATWQGICRTLEDHLSHHIRAVCGRETLRSFPYRSRLFLSGKGKRQLHVVSKQLFNLALCRQDISDVESIDSAYLDLLEFLLLYATVCLEMISLARIHSKTTAIEKLTSTPLLSGDRVWINAGGHKTQVLTEDLSALVIRQPKQNTDGPTTGLSLRQISLLALLGCGVDCGNDTITILKPQGFREDVFQSFIHASLICIPNIELTVKNEITEICSVLRSNEEIGRLKSLEVLRDAVNILAQDLSRVRSSYGVKRRFGCADGKRFPLYVRCRSLFRRPLRVKKHALPGCVLTNSFPSSKTGYYCSWDISDSEPTSLMIPSEGLHSLVQDLMRGDIFGFKLSTLYSGRLMIVWDAIAFIATALALGYCEHTKGSIIASTGMKDACSVLTYLLGPLFWILLGKLLIFDLRHWSSRYQKAMTCICSKFNSQE